MTRVLHIIGSADPRSGGPVEGAVRIADAWRRQGHRQDLLTLDPPGAPFLSGYVDRVIALGNVLDGRIRYGYSPDMIGWIRDHAAEYDAVIVAGLWNYAVLAARCALVGGKVPYFVYTHGMLDPWFRRTYPVKALGKQLSWLVNEGPLLAHARAVLFTTQEEMDLARDAFRPYRVRGKVVGYGTDYTPGDRTVQIAAFHDRVPAVRGRRFLLFLSRIHEKKGCDLLIAAYADIANAHPDLDLVIAGPGSPALLGELAAQAQRLGMADRIHFPGMLEGDAKWGAFQASEAMTLTSHQENFGVVVAEAMACGKPVLITDRVNIWHEVKADGAGLVEADTLDGARRLLDRFLAMSAAERAAMGAAAKISFERRFTAQAAADTLMTLIQTEIANPATG